MKQVKELLAKQMTRAEFLRFMGMAIVASFGLTNLISFLLKHSNQSTHPFEIAREPTIQGFGSRSFGN